MLVAGNLPLFMCWPALALFCLFALGIEKLGVQRLEMERKVSPVLRLHLRLNCPRTTDDHSVAWNLAERTVSCSVAHSFTLSRSQHNSMPVATIDSLQHVILGHSWICFALFILYVIIVVCYSFGT